MKPSDNVDQLPNFTYYIDCLGSTSSSAGYTERWRKTVDNVFSVSNPKPWKNALSMAAQSYRITTVLNKQYVIWSNGWYIQQPWQQVIKSYGRPVPGDLVYLKSPIVPYEYSSTDERALQKVLDKARGEHANLAVDLAEGRQTLRMLKDAINLRKQVLNFATNVVKQRGYKKIRKGPTQGQRRLDYVNGKWLEYRYGWMPLMSSIHDVGEALRKKHFDSFYLLKGRASNSKEFFSSVGTGSYTDWTRSLHVEGSYRTEIGAFFRPSNTTFSDFTSLNPLSIAWELVPFSFVADWALGIGQCLENWENWLLFRESFIRGYKTNTYREERRASWFGSSSYGMNYRYAPALDRYVIADGTSREVRWYSTNVRYVSKNRYMLNSLPVPGGPTVKVNLNAKRMLDSAALIGQYVRKFR